MEKPVRSEYAMTVPAKHRPIMVNLAGLGGISAPEDVLGSIAPGVQDHRKVQARKLSTRWTCALNTWKPLRVEPVEGYPPPLADRGGTTRGRLDPGLPETPANKYCTSTVIWTSAWPAQLAAAQFARGPSVRICRALAKGLERKLQQASKRKPTDRLTVTSSWRHAHGKDEAHGSKLAIKLRRRATNDMQGACCAKLACPSSSDDQLTSPLLPISNLDISPGPVAKRHAFFERYWLGTRAT
eukprot:scaffold4007_cov362-Prasinococcus_capsulatus_cf.AAC.2